MKTDQNILVTGGGGSVGRALIRRFLSSEPSVIRVFDNHEPSLARLKSQFGDDDRIRFLAGDIRDRERVERAMEGVDIVVHTAAMKHVDIAEYNPFEAVQTNVVGLQNVINAAIDGSVERFVFTSSDKAVNPSNTMGTTKQLGERLTTAGNKYRGKNDLRLASVRFGNVLNSSHSVVPIFHDQIRSGGPVKLTDERMTRFFLTYDGIAELVDQAIEVMEGGEIFLRKMDAIKIRDLAEAMIEVVAPKYGHNPDAVDIELIGRRVGETLHEEIMTERQAERALQNEDLYAIPPETTETNGYLTYDGLDGFGPVESLTCSSNDVDTLGIDEIIDLLEANNPMGAAP